MRVAPSSIAKLMSVIMFERRYFPLLTQVIVGGINEKPEIYTLRSTRLLMLPTVDARSRHRSRKGALGIMDAEFTAKYVRRGS